MSDDPDAGSPPCFAHELVGGHPVDPQTARDVARFRRAERRRLWDLRRALPVEENRRQARTIADGLDRVIGPMEGRVVAAYWPIRAEPDLRDWMARAHQAGARIALPMVVGKDAPLVFRAWQPGCRMERGVWNIPVPAEDLRLIPDVVIAPVVGIDSDGYRLGNGGGYYDRTLAGLHPFPLCIGIGHDFSRIPTIFPMPWDIPMQSVVLGEANAP